MENTQKVRHIPIFVEGRDEPVINKGHEGDGAAAQPQVNAAPQSSPNNTSAFASAESSSGPYQQTHHNFGRPPMGFEGDMGFRRDMGFGSEMPMHSGSIFDRAKDFPVRDFFNMRSGSPRRSESPSSVNQQYHQNHHQPRSSASPAGPQQRQQPPQNFNQDRPVPVHHDSKRSSTPQRQPEPTHAAQQPQQQQPQHQPQEQAPVPEQEIPARQKAIEDSITKIQKIQASVLDLMSSVEQFDGTNKKEYAYLDEMLTQNLLKLDNIDAEGKENIKSARREAIKCINSLISLLEAKKDQAAKSLVEAGANQEATSTNGELEPPTHNGVNGASRNSSYDNVNNVKQTPSNNSVNMAEANKAPEVSAEVSLEEKVQEAIQKQGNQ